MEIIKLRTRRSLTEFLLQLEAGEIKSFLIPSAPRTRQEWTVFVASEINHVRFIKLDMDVKFSLGRRDKRLDLVVRGRSRLDLCVISVSSNPETEARKLSILIPEVEREVQALNLDIQVAGIVVEIGKTHPVSEFRKERYSTLGINFHTIETFVCNFVE